MSRRPHVLILLENLPLEKDARVKRESRALLEAGYDVTVICPRGSRRDPVPGVRVLSYPPPPEGSTPLAFVVEYAWSLVAAALLTARAALSGRIDAVQACNPPDIYWLLAAPCQWLGMPFVFDHHDLSPEMYEARSGRRTGVLASVLRFMERRTLRRADHVIATNDSVREVSLRRGGRAPDTVTVVRNGPELTRLQVGRRRPELRADHDHLAVWLGVIGVDDGVEQALVAVHELVSRRGRRDCLFVFLGDGERLAACQALAADLGVEDHVRFPGWVEQDEAFEYLASADLALAPDPPGPRSDRSTMMKVMEYMAAGLPVIAHRVPETEISAEGAGVYVAEGPAAYAAAIDELLDDPDRRARMGDVGRRRIGGGLSWDHQKQAYVELYRRLLAGSAA